jgi:hypothetical protein
MLRGADAGEADDPARIDAELEGRRAASNTDGRRPMRRRHADQRISAEVSRPFRAASEARFAVATRRCRIQAVFVASS